jgi:transcription initiation factor TFIIB
MNSVKIGPELPKTDLSYRLFCKDCKGKFSILFNSRKKSHFLTINSDPIANIVEDFSAGDLICGNCGLVLGNRIIDTRSEWRTYE